MSQTLQTGLNSLSANQVADGTRIVKLGNALSRGGLTLSQAVVSDIMVLAVPATAVVSCYATAGGAPGVKSPVVFSALAAGSVAVNPAGDLEFDNADGVTAAEVVYIGAEGDLITEQLTVTASSATLLQSRSAAVLRSVTVDVGVVLGAKAVGPRGAAPALGIANIDNAGTAITFNAGDVVNGTATVSYIAQPGIGTAGESTLGLLSGLQDVLF